MPQIIPNQTFKHGNKTYEKDVPAEVSEGEAFYFQQVGWAGEQQASSQQHDLQIDDVRVKAESEVV